jgi:hypothetical protein
MKKLERRGCEEVEIQFIDGECGLSRLARGMSYNGEIVEIDREAIVINAHEF